jgi:hypothetical protein
MPKTPQTWDASGYATVAERMQAFRAAHPEAQVVTELHTWENGRITFRAAIYRNAAEPRPAATGWASEREGDGEINTNACLENAETSAVGRALANLGYAGTRERAGREPSHGTAHRRTDPPVRLVREASPRDAKADAERRAAFDARQEHADAVKDACSAVTAAERAGLPAADVRRHLRVLAGRSVPPSEIARIERELRAWMRARFPGPPAGAGDEPARDEPV